MSIKYDKYMPLYTYLSPASIPQIVAHIQDYLVKHPILSVETIAEIIVQSLQEHPELINGAAIPISADSEQSIKAYIDSLPSIDTYTKAEINTLLTGKQDTLTFDQAPTPGSSNPVTSSGIIAAMSAMNEALETLINAKADSVSTYTKTQVDTLLTDKANTDDVYSKNTMDAKLLEYATSESVYSKQDINTMKQVNKANLAIVSTDGTAPLDIAAGQYVYYDDVLFMATEEILTGARLVPNSNIVLNPTGVTNRIGDGLKNAVTQINGLAETVSNQSQQINGLTETVSNQSQQIENLENMCNRNAGFHNSIYRGKNLGSSVSAEQWAQIGAGTFDDMFIGDYWVINGVTWRIAAFDYWVNANSLSKHHVVIVPDANLATCQMNSTNTTAGAYYNSDFRTGNNSNTGRATAISAVNGAFGSAHILTYKDYLHSAVVDGHPSGQEWADCTVELMNEEMVYGAHIFAPIANGSAVYSNYTTSKSQLPLFQHDHSRISNRTYWWLRSVVSSANFAIVNDSGSANYASASSSLGVRPAFGIVQS